MDRLLGFVQVSFCVGAYIFMSFIGNVALEKLGKLLHTRPMRLGWILSVMFMPIIFPIVAAALLISAVPRIFERKRHGIEKDPRNGKVS